MDAIQKAFAISDAKISFVSLVNKAANKKQFLITKAENGSANFLSNGMILKSDADSHYVTGVVYAPMEEDAHGNYMTEEEIRKSAYWFTKNGNQIDIQHEFEPIADAVVVESWIEKADTTIEGQPIKKGTWLMTVELPDDSDAWDSIQKGELTGFSMGGVGKYSEVDDDISALEKSASTSEQKGIFARIAKALGFEVVEKGTVADKFKQKTQRTLFWDAWYSLQETLCRYNYFTDRDEFETNESVIREALEEFSEIVINTLAEKSLTKSLLPVEGAIEKAGKKLSTKNRAALENVYESLGAFLAETTEKEEKEMDEKAIQKMIDDSIKKALEPQTPNPAPAETTPAGEGETPITADTIEKMVAAAVQKAMGTGETPAAPAETPITAENVADTINAAVQKAMEPVLKAKGLPVNLNNEGEVKKSEEEPHYMTGMF
ncbi:MAG: hypothetical protein IJC04_00365 [Oscillospiraceae bacterium]|nr:hypothetical protein [Oscillospiraceae bacterium]